MTNQLISPRLEYSFPDYIDVPVSATADAIANSIQDMLRQEFNVVCELESVETSENKDVVSHGDFVSCLDMLTGDLHHFCLDVEKLSDIKVDFKLVPKKKHFIKAMVFRWRNTRDIRHAKFDFY